MAVAYTDDDSGCGDECVCVEGLLSSGWVTASVHFKSKYLKRARLQFHH